jgi:methionyl aminopeptidase
VKTENNVMVQNGADANKKKSKKKDVVPTEQTWPEPTVPIQDLFPKGEFPEGQISEYQGL